MDISFSILWNNLLQTLPTSLNDLGSLHPAIIHIPIALLLIAPIFIIIGLVCKNSARTFFISALILLILGTLSIFLSTYSGEKAAEFVELNPGVKETLTIHYHLAEKVRLTFSILTSVFLTYILLYSFLIRKFSLKTHQLALMFFLIFYAYNIFLLLNTAHQGGKLVHFHGVTSDLYSE